MTDSVEYLIPVAEVEKRVGLKRQTLYVMMRKGRFPAPLKVGVKAVRWRSSEVEEWLNSRPRAEGDLVSADIRQEVK
jgi:predicted DNA-binding transcriptional regulator AlpA